MKTIIKFTKPDGTQLHLQTEELDKQNICEIISTFLEKKSGKLDVILSDLRENFLQYSTKQ